MCYISSFMEVYNLPTGEGKTEGKRNVDLQKDIDNSTGRTSKQRRNLKENGSKKGDLESRRDR